MSMTAQPELFAAAEIGRLVTVPADGIRLGDAMAALGLEWDEVRPCFGTVLFYGKHYVRDGFHDLLLGRGVRALADWFERPCRVVEMEAVC